MKPTLKIGSTFLLLLIWCFTSHMVAETIQFTHGKWQTIVDGEGNEGGLFYRLDFQENNQLIITKQCGGSDNIIEHKTWHQEGNYLNIQGKSKDAIKEFDGTKLKVINDNTLDYENGFYKSEVKPFIQSLAIIHWILILVVLIGLNELFRRYKTANVLFYIVLPLILTPLVWSQQGVSHWFKWVKVYSVIFAVIWFTLIRYTKMGNYKWAKIGAATILALNILEAVSQDLSMGFLPNILNGIAGLLNAITLYYAWKQIGPDRSKEKDMVWSGMTLMWIAAYDIWNITYVYLNFPGSTSAQFMVILACTIPALFIKKGTWLQARGFTLAAWFMYYFTFPRFTEQMELLVPRSYNIMLIVASISIILNVIYFGIFISKIIKDRKLNKAAFR